MRILVCVKQVPLAREVQLDPQTNTLVREGVPSIVNPSDLNALEAALLLKDTHGAEITVVSMGPLQAEQAVRECLDMGADEGFLLCDQSFAGSDTLATATVLAKFVRSRKGSFDLVLCGHESIDGNTAQVGPELAELLGLDQVSCATGVVLEGTGELTARVQRRVGRTTQRLAGRLPLLITILREANTPRERGRSAAAVQPVGAEHIDCSEEESGLAGSPTKVVKIFPPKPVRKFHAQIDSRLPARKRIELILDGGIVAKEHQTVVRVEELGDGELRSVLSAVFETGEPL